MKLPTKWGFPDTILYIIEFTYFILECLQETHFRWQFRKINNSLFSLPSVISHTGGIYIAETAGQVTILCAGSMANWNVFTIWQQCRCKGPLPMKFIAMVTLFEW